MKLHFAVLAALTAACGVESPSEPNVSGAGGAAAGHAAVPAAGSATGGMAQAAGSAAMAGSGGTSTGGTGGSVTNGGGNVATAGAGGAGGAGGAAPEFACSQFLGPNVVGEWFEAGFETFVKADTWQVKAPHHSFVEDWADPNHDVWLDSNCQGTYTNCETKSKCGGNATPDRILFITQVGDYLGTSQADWQSGIAAAILTLKQKYPGLKRVELLTFLRGPGNTSCGNETTVAPELDAAQAALAAASGGFISVGPRFELQNCGQFGSTPHLTGPGNSYAAELIGKHYGTP